MPPSFRATRKERSMVTAYFKSAPTIARYRAGSAGPHLDRFVAWRSNQSYRRVSIRPHVREVANFAAWAVAGIGRTRYGSPRPCCRDATARLPFGPRSSALPKWQLPPCPPECLYSFSLLDLIGAVPPPADPIEKIETVEGITPLRLKRGRFTVPDQLIESLKAR